MKRLTPDDRLAGIALLVAFLSWLWRANNPADSGQAAQVVLGVIAAGSILVALRVDARTHDGTRRPWMLWLSALLAGSASLLAMIQGVWLAAITPALVVVTLVVLGLRPGIAQRRPDGLQPVDVR